MAEGVIERRAYARIGLLGNPSDVYFGRTISLSIANFSATVRLEPSQDLVIRPHPFHDLVSFSSIQHLVNRLQSEGYYGGVRLLMATCKIFYKYCSDQNIELKEGNFTLSYDTNIPRQTGLSGSSAIVCAAFNCLLDFYKVRHLVKVEIRPDLILNAEKELGIVAGLQDRVAQIYGGLVYMDFSKEHMDNLGHGLYSPMDIGLLPPLYLIYAENPSDSGKLVALSFELGLGLDGKSARLNSSRDVFTATSSCCIFASSVDIHRSLMKEVHSYVRQRWIDGDAFIRSSMEEVANLALEGRRVLLEKDYTQLTSLMNHNFDLRRQMFGDDALGSINIKMIEVARSVGAACKFTGSGGAAVAFCPEGPAHVQLLEEACNKAGFTVAKVEVVPPVLGEEDLKTVSLI